MSASMFIVLVCVGGAACFGPMLWMLSSMERVANDQPRWFWPVVFAGMTLMLGTIWVTAWVEIA